MKPDISDIKDLKTRRNMCLTCPHRSLMMEKTDKAYWDPPMPHRCHESWPTICKGSTITGSTLPRYKEDLEEL